jgi:inosine/xanthosine triphosphate pyrophosphatase family protein
MTILLLATRNSGKKREMEDFLQAGERRLRLLSLSDLNVAQDVVESGKTIFSAASPDWTRWGTIRGWKSRP